MRQTGAPICQHQTVRAGRVQRLIILREFSAVFRWMANTCLIHLFNLGMLRTDLSKFHHS